MRDQGAKEGTLTAACLQRLDLRKPEINPPNVRRIPRTFEYLRIYAIEWAYLEPRRQQETLRHFKRRVYGTLRSMATTATPPREVRVTQIQPGTDWVKSGVISTTYQHPREPDLHGTRCSMTYCPPTQDYIESNWRKRRTAHCAGKRIPLSTDSRNVEQQKKYGNGSEYGWQRYIERTEDAYPLNGYWGPVSDSGHDNDISRHCGSWRTSYTI